MSQSAPDLDPAVLAGSIHRLSVAQYDLMTRAGILGPDDHVELLEGWLVEKMTKRPGHRIATHQTREVLERLAPKGWYVDSREPIVTADSEPEPDVAVIRGRTRDYVAGNPPADRVGLVVEVADASLLRDRELKARIYARARIPTYWIVNLADRAVEVFSQPRSRDRTAAYASRVIVSEAENVTFVLDGHEVARVAVADLLA